MYLTIFKDLKETVKQNLEILDISTINNEKYRCTIPVISDDSNDINGLNTVIRENNITIFCFLWEYYVYILN